MIEFRPLCLPTDCAALLALDTSFTTDRVYHLERTDRSFALKEARVSPSVHKSYSLTDEVNTLPTFDWVQIASDGDALVGLLAMKIASWNRRANLCHLYLAPAIRGLGIGRAMVEAALCEARRCEARSIWVETQTLNYGAIRFYERLGFRWCGLDISLYDPSKVEEGEIALFFSRSVA